MITTLSKTKVLAEPSVALDTNNSKAEDKNTATNIRTASCMPVYLTIPE